MVLGWKKQFEDQFNDGVVSLDKINEVLPTAKTITETSGKLVFNATAVDLRWEAVNYQPIIASKDLSGIRDSATSAYCIHAKLLASGSPPAGTNHTVMAWDIGSNTHKGIGATYSIGGGLGVQTKTDLSAWSNLFSAGGTYVDRWLKIYWNVSGGTITTQEGGTLTDNNFCMYHSTDGTNYSLLITNTSLPFIPTRLGLALWTGSGTSTTSTMESEFIEFWEYTELPEAQVTDIYYAISDIGTDVELWKYDGSSWALATTILIGASVFPSAIWALHENAVYIALALGNTDEAVVYFWNGTSASVLFTIPSGGDDHYVFGIWGTATDNMYFAEASQSGGAGAVWKWDGNSATQFLNDQTNRPHVNYGRGWVGIWGSDENNIWAVSDEGATGGWPAQIYYYDGNTWIIQYDRTNNFYANSSTSYLDGVSNTEIYVVGGNSDAEVLRYNGTSWNQELLLNQVGDPAQFASVWSGQNLTHVFSFSPRRIYSKIDGGSWTQTATPSTTVFDVAGNPDGTSSIYITGSNGTFWNNAYDVWGTPNAITTNLRNITFSPPAPLDTEPPTFDGYPSGDLPAPEDVGVVFYPPNVEMTFAITDDTAVILNSIVIEVNDEVVFADGSFVESWEDSSFGELNEVNGYYFAIHKAGGFPYGEVVTFNVVASDGTNEANTSFSFSIEEDNEPPILDDYYPDDSLEEYPIDTEIDFSVSDNDRVILDSVIIQINSQSIFENGVFSENFLGSSYTPNEEDDGYDFILVSSEGFNYEDTIEVNVYAEDPSGNFLDTSFSFDIEEEPEEEPPPEEEEPTPPTTNSGGATIVRSSQRILAPNPNPPIVAGRLIPDVYVRTRVGNRKIGR